MYHRKTYMRIFFQQNRVSRSVKTVHTNLFAKKSEFIQLEFGKTTPYRHAQPSNGHSSFSSPMLTREDREYSHTIAFDGELFAYSIPYQNQFVTSQIVLFVASNKDLIATSTVFLISPALLDTTTVRMVEIAYDGGHSVMT